MWYVIQVFTGKEEQIVLQCRKRIRDPKILNRCFVPRYVQKRRYEGHWHTEEKLLFPGYVFLVSDNGEELFLSLKKIDGLTKMIGTGQEIVPLSREEEGILRRLGGEEQLVETSTGIMVSDQIIVTDGPLQGMEGCIKKIDRHKRLAWIEVPLMGRILEARVGLEVVEKR